MDNATGNDFSRSAAVAPRANNRVPRVARTLVWVAAFTCGYVLLQWLSASMRFPPIYMTTIWLPGALLLSCMLLTPPRRWWMYALATTLAVVIVHSIDPVVPLPTALIALPFFLAAMAGGAWAIVRTGGGGTPLRTLPSLAVLAVVAVVLIPLAGVGPTIAYRLATNEPNTWIAARSAGLAMAMGTLIGTPALMLTFAQGAAWVRAASWKRYLELAGLSLALLAVALFVFARPYDAGHAPAILYAPLPLLLWAAVRFGLAGISWAMLGLSVLAALASIREWGPFTDHHTQDANILQLQLFVIGAAAPLMFLAAIIQDRRLVAAQLGASEERYREVVESQRDLVCRYLPDTTLTFVNDAYCQFFGKPRDELIGRRFLSLIPPVGQGAALRHIRSLNRDRRTVSYEHEVLLPDGTIGWHQWVDYAAVMDDGQITEYQGIGRDVTDRKRAEDALRRNEEALRSSYNQIQELAGRLIEAQEGERSRLARELHDNVSQQLAALSIALSTLRRRVAHHPEVQEELTRLQARTGEMAEDIRHLSHELHPGVLRHAGLVAALRSRCVEFGTQHGIEATLCADEDLSALPPDVSLCLYRVAQEALRNVVKHARARQARMVLTRAEGCLELTVADDGVGFDVSHARESGGLGLMSLDERVRLINGNIAIESGPQQGTKVRVRVPLETP